MLQKSERLKEKHLFSIAFNLGKKKKQKLSTNLISLYYLFRRKDINKLSSQTKVAFVIGTKIDKRASRRNLLKRRMISAYKQIRKANFNYLDTKNLALIWVGNASIKDATFEQIKNSMVSLLSKLREDNRV